MTNHKAPTLSVPMHAPKTKTMGYLDILTAAETYSVTNAADPFVRYLRNNRPQTEIERLAEKASMILYLMVSVRTKVVHTVGHGHANVVGTPPKNNPPPPRDDLTSFLEDLRGLLRKQRDKLTRDIEKRRLLTFEDKMARTVHEYFGDHIDDMWYLEGLCTRPDWRRKGYGGALVDSITTLADDEGKTCWLQSSNIQNTRFYEKHGFVSITTVTVGENDPDWRWPLEPVVITVMIRTPNL